MKIKLGKQRLNQGLGKLKSEYKILESIKKSF